MLPSPRNASFIETSDVGVETQVSEKQPPINRDQN
jgi:hypothetical protein